MNLNQLYYFRTLAGVLNFRRASEMLHIAQPTLSVAMFNLEDELGVSLFVREGRHIELTKCGMEFQTGLNRILGDLDDLTVHMKRLSTREQGHVDIGYIAPMAKSYIPQKVREFLNEPEHGGVTFRFREASTSALVEGLKARQYDVVFCPFVSGETNVVFTPILKQEIVAIVPPDHPLAQRESIFLRELADYPFIAYMPRSGLRRQIDILLDRGGLVPNIISDASDEDAIAALVSNGFGVACVACDDSILNGKAVVLKLKDPDCIRMIYMAYLRAGQQPPSVQDFIRFMREKRSADALSLSGQTDIELNITV